MGYWTIGQDLPIDFNEAAHTSVIHDMLWHPMGHILTTGSEDQEVKIWYNNITA